MARAVEIHRLERDDDRRGFSCGQADLDRFFIEFAGQNQFRLGIATTYVAVAEDSIVGFATVTMGTIERRDLPDSRRKKLPAYPLPVVRLARLGVDLRARGAGIGQALLRFALRLAVAQRETIGCLGVVADAKAEAIEFYRRFGFIALDEVREGLLPGDPTPLFLPMSSILDALGGER